jgi:ATP-dependent helicase HrpB
MVLDEQQRPASPGNETIDALIERVRVTRLGVVKWTERARQLRRRIEFAAAHVDGAWPAVDDTTLVASLHDWLGPFLQHATSRSDLEAVDVEMVLGSMLSWDQQTLLAELVPATLTTPSGRTLVIDYERDNPTVSVRVQDMFGTLTHPTIANDVPVTIELLSPADRPIQITNDIPGFWSGSWAMVRKELAGRYPKHQWPIDPARAEPKRLKDRPPD